MNAPPQENDMPKTVLITGAGSGFGRGAAVQLAARGHKVIATVEKEQQVAELSKAHPGLSGSR
jgi:NAD(P)-dependent dehydrogenase (short-subunit alcohol dehydrogenase family)